MRITKPPGWSSHEARTWLTKNFENKLFPCIIDFIVPLSSALLSSWKEKFQIFWPRGDPSLSDFRVTL